MSHSSLKVTGLSESIEALKDFDEQVRTKYVRKSLKAGAKVIGDRAEALAPEKKGILRASVRVRTFDRKSKNLIGALVSIGGPRAGKAFYGTFVNAGHTVGRRGHKMFRGAAAALVRARGAMGAKFADFGEAVRDQYRTLTNGRQFVEGKHFMEAAYEQKKEQAVGQVQSTLAGLIEKHDAKS